METKSASLWFKLTLTYRPDLPWTYKVSLCVLKFWTIKYILHEVHVICDYIPHTVICVFPTNTCAKVSRKIYSLPSFLSMRWAAATHSRNGIMYYFCFSPLKPNIEHYIQQISEMWSFGLICCLAGAAYGKVDFILHLYGKLSEQWRYSWTLLLLFESLNRLYFHSIILTYCS